MTIKDIRSKTGLTQRDFAERLGMSIGNVRNWEQGVREPSEWVIKLIDYYAENEILKSSDMTR